MEVKSMILQRKKRPIFVLIVVGLCLGVGVIPIMNGNETSANSYQNYTINFETAQKVAKVKLHELEKTEFSISSSAQIINEKKEPLFYVFNLDPQGYLVVTASYHLPPVIAYSFTSSFQDTLVGNPLYDILYADITLRLENINLIPVMMIEERHLQWDSYIKGKPANHERFEQWPPEGSTPTGGWLLTNWHQNAPYNNFCPLDLAHGGRSVAGCPAVTIAQILNYHNTTMNVTFDDGDDYYHNYNGNNYWIDNDYLTYGFPSFPQLNTYLTTLQSHYEAEVPPTNDDKAAITFACGVAATQVYGSGGSGTFGVNQAYDAYQRFNCTTSEILDENDPDLYQRLASNMKDALPAHLAVVNEGWTSGHNLVIDGYNTNNYYHLNFGWGGSNNGWYLIPDELPYSLTVIEGVILDILNDDLICEGSCEWTDVTPCKIVTGSFSVSNIGDASSNLAWEVSEWPTWGTWTFTPSQGNNLRPEDGPFTITVDVQAPNEELTNYTGEIIVKNRKNSSDFSSIPVSLQTGRKINEKLFCNGSLTWVNVKPGATMTGSFTVENAGAPFTNLSWEIVEYPAWGTWTCTPAEGNHLTPEDGPITINVSVVAPKKRHTEFTGQIKVVNTMNSSDWDTIPISLATPYQPHPFLLEILERLLERFPHAFPLLRFLLKL
jgi:hypothetical protein